MLHKNKPHTHHTHTQTHRHTHTYTHTHTHTHTHTQNPNITVFRRSQMVVMLTLLVASSKERLCCAQECALVQQMWPDCKTIVLSFKRTNSVTFDKGMQAREFTSFLLIALLSVMTSQPFLPANWRKKSEEGRE